jgi:hypothetical protein
VAVFINHNAYFSLSTSTSQVNVRVESLFATEAVVVATVKFCEEIQDEKSSSSSAAAAAALAVASNNLLPSCHGSTGNAVCRKECGTKLSKLCQRNHFPFVVVFVFSSFE